VPFQRKLLYTDSATGVLVPAALSITGGTANGVGHFTATCSGAKDGAGILRRQ